MLNRKSKKITVPKVETTQVTVPTLHGIKQAVVPAVTGAAVAAKQWGDDHAHAAGDWAKPRIEQGRESAQAAAEALSERSEEARDRLESAPPKLSAAVSGLLAAGAASREEAQKNTAKKVKDLKKQAKKQQAKVKPEKKKSGLLGNILATLGILAAAGAIAAYLSKKQSAPKDDPWARPLTDPYVATTDTTSTGSATTGTTTSTVGAAAGATALGSDAGATDFTAGATSTNSIADELAEPAVTDVPIADIDATPPAKLENDEVVDLTADGLPPEGDAEVRDATTTTFSETTDTTENDKGR